MHIKGREKVGIEKLKNPKAAFINYPQITDDIYENLRDCNATKKSRKIITFDDMIVGIESNKKLSPKVIELFLRVRKNNIALVFISQSCFNVPKTIRINATHYFITKVPNKRELQQIASNQSSNIRNILNIS